jgi:hypothetical protein
MQQISERIRARLPGRGAERETMGGPNGGTSVGQLLPELRSGDGE